MDYRSQLLTLASTFATARGLSEARVATLVQNSGSFFERIRNGATCTVDVYLRVQQWFADQWPEGVEWPAGVDRPGVLPLSRHLDPPCAAAPTRDGAGVDDGGGVVSAAAPVDPIQPTPDKEAA